MSSTTLSATMTRIDTVVRDMHMEREGHVAKGYWTERTENAGRMMPRQFVPTCCNNR